MKNTIVLLALLGIFTLFSCEKDTSQIDDSAPNIEVFLPAVQQVANGDTININALITENDELHEIKSAITRLRDNQEDTVWHLATHSHFKEFMVLGMYVVKDAAPGDVFTFSVEASDHNGNIGKQSMDIYWRD